MVMKRASGAVLLGLGALIFLYGIVSVFLWALDGTVLVHVHEPAAMVPLLMFVAGGLTFAGLFLVIEEP